MAFLLKRVDQGGGFVAPAGSPKAYTKRRDHARRFATRAEAERERCGNEVICDA